MQYSGSRVSTRRCGLNIVLRGTQEKGKGKKDAQQKAAEGEKDTAPVVVKKEAGVESSPKAKATDEPAGKSGGKTAKGGKDAEAKQAGKGQAGKGKAGMCCHLLSPLALGSFAAFVLVPAECAQSFFRSMRQVRLSGVETVS